MFDENRDTDIGKSEFIPPRMALLPVFLAKTKIIDYKVLS